MERDEVSNAIKALIKARDEQGAIVQGVIDFLFENYIITGEIGEEQRKIDEAYEKIYAN